MYRAANCHPPARRYQIRHHEVDLPVNSRMPTLSSHDLDHYYEVSTPSTFSRTVGVSEGVRWAGYVSARMATLLRVALHPHCSFLFDVDPWAITWTPIGAFSAPNIHSTHRTLHTTHHTPHAALSYVGHLICGA